MKKKWKNPGLLVISKILLMHERRLGVREGVREGVGMGVIRWWMR